MADADKDSAAGKGSEREVPVDWEALEDAFENNAPEVHSYLHLPTGEVLRVVDGIADPEMHSRIASDTEYMRVEPHRPDSLICTSAMIQAPSSVTTTFPRCGPSSRYRIASGS